MTTAEKLLEEIDKETSEPEDKDDDDDDAAEPDSESEPEDTRGPLTSVASSFGVNLGASFEGKVQRQFEALTKNRGKAALTLQDALALAKHTAATAAKTGASHGAKKERKRIIFAPPPAPGAIRPRPHAVEEMRNDVIASFKAKHGQSTVDDRGFYYGTAEIILAGDGSPMDAGLVAKPGDFPVFQESVDDKKTRLGHPYTVRTIDTNLQNPGELLFPDQVFIIERISARFRGVRVRYNESAVSALPISDARKAALLGKSLLWDDGGIVLPREIFADYSEECLLAKQLAASSVIFAQWKEKGLGGNAKERNILLDTFEQIPSVGGKNLTDTSGGSHQLDLPQGYIWTLNPRFKLNDDTGGNGLFSVQLVTDHPFYYPINAVDIAGKGPLVPEQFGIYWEFRLHGTSIRPKGVTMLEKSKR